MNTNERAFPLDKIQHSILTIFALLAIHLGLFAQDTHSQVLAESLMLRLEASGSNAANDWILSTRTLPAFYEERNYQPAWVTETGTSPMLKELIGAIERVSADGLKAEDYHLNRIRELVARLQSASTLASQRTAILTEIELRSSDAFLMLASHLLAGRTNPETIEAEWIAVRREANPVRNLQMALDNGQVARTLESLVPAYEDYYRLRRGRARYEQIAHSGGWSIISEGPKLEAGISGPRVLDLRKRLAATGELEAASTGKADYDDVLKEAVIRFQRRHGLDPDGVVGPATLAALNVSARDRVRQIEVNLERWRWLPQDLGRRYLLLNIANFELDVIADGSVVMNMRSIVGRRYRRTPVFSDQVKYIVLNPRWNVPFNIATHDILPKLRTDPNYLASQNMKLYQGWGADQLELAQSAVDWSEVTARNFNYRLLQEPGPSNALGRVKFMFPNKFNVYLHDTPSRELFARTERTFSSGCIRLEKPLDLAEYLLSANNGWNRAALEKALATGKEQTVILANPMPVHLLYWTAWSEIDGTVQFRTDIYSRDKPVRDALDEPPPRG